MTNREEINIVVNLDDTDIISRLKDIQLEIDKLSTKSKELSLKDMVGGMKDATKGTKDLFEGVEKAANATAGFGTIIGGLGIAGAVLQFANLALGILGTVSAFDEQKSAIEENTEVVQKELEERQKLKDEASKKASESASEFDYYARLKKELDGIIDANGKVKDGYEDRAEVIATTLSEATGTEIRLSDGVIENYENIAKAIDEVIKKKKAQAILDAHYDTYASAVKKESDDLKQLTKAQEEYNDRLRTKQDYIDIFINSAKLGGTYDSGTQKRAEEAFEEELAKYKANIEEKKKIYQKDLDTMSNYEQGMTDFQNGRYENLEKTLNGENYLYTENSKEKKKILNNNKSEELTILRNFDEVTKNLPKEQREILEAEHKNSLAEYQMYLLSLEGVLKEGTPAYAEAMAYLQEEGVNAFDENGDLTKIAQDKIDELGAQALGVSTEQYTEIMAILSAEGVQAFDENGDLTDIAAKRISELNEVFTLGDVEYSAMMKQLALNGVEVYDANGDIQPAAQTKLTSLLSYLKGQGITDVGYQMFLLSKLGPEYFEQNGDLTDAGKDTIQGFVNGADENTRANQTAMGNFAISFLTIFKNKLGINSPSREFKKLGVGSLKGYKNGFIEQSKDVLKTVENSAQKITDEFNDNLHMDVAKIGKDLPIMKLAYTLDDNSSLNNLDTLQSQFQNQINGEMNLRTGQPLQNNYAVYFNQTINSKEVLSASENAMQAEALLDRERWKLK